MTLQNIQEQTPPILVGSKIEKSCSIHGDYQAEVISISFKGRPIYHPCPSCSEEREKEDAELVAQFEREQIAAMKKASGVPKRFFECRIEDYIPPNKEAEKALSICAKYLSSFKDRLEVGGGLVFCGMPGTGKTHLACAIALAVIDQRYCARYTTTYKAMSTVKESFGDHDRRDVLGEFTRPDLLVIDEVGVQYGSEAEKIIFYQIINGRYEDVKPTILISNLNESELSTFIGERCLDRMREGGGAVITFTWKSYRK